MQRSLQSLAPAAETYTARSTATATVQFNKVYPTPWSAVPSISTVSASDKRCSLADERGYVE